MTEPSGQTPASPSPSPPPRRPLFGDCWSCRILSGGGLFLAAGYVYLAGRRGLRQPGQTRFGTVVQLTFAACLASWGVVVIADPIGKNKVKDS